ncbi:hypothetical protein SLS54_010085 [Diplodia seriata]
MMLSAHTDQENLAAAHQQAAAAKPLNAGTRAFAAKTPANKAPKTPFKVALNDENGTARAGKTALNTVGKGPENQLLPTGKKGGKVDNNAFVTPAGGRTRAPLGMKTTNAKAAAFATPAPQTEPDSEKAGVRSSGPRLRRAKVKVHQASPAVELAHDGERDIEYMPPQEIPLPDDPEDWPSDMQYPQLEGENLMRGSYQVYYDPVDDDGVHLSDKRIAEQKAKVNASHEAMLQRNIEETLGPLTEEEPWSRHASNTTSVADTRSQDENDDPEMEMIREMALRNLRLTDRLGGDDWFSRAQSGPSAFDIADEEEDFQFTIPEA